MLPLPGSMLPKRTRGATQAQKPNCCFFDRRNQIFLPLTSHTRKRFHPTLTSSICDKYHFVQLNAENVNVVCKHKWWHHPNIWSTVLTALTSPSMVEAMWWSPDCTLGKVKENPPSLSFLSSSTLPFLQGSLGTPLLEKHLSENGRQPNGKHQWTCIYFI